MMKAVFFDVDGTIYSHKTNSVPESTLQALKKLREQGIQTFLATGRHFAELDKLLMGKISFDGYVALNGQLCTDGEKNVVHGNPVQGENAAYLLSAFSKKELPMLIVEKEKMYANLINEEVIRAQAAISTPLPQLGVYTGEPVYQFICYGGKELEEQLAQKIPDCKMTRWSPYGVDIISKTGGKAAGIRKMMEIYDLRREEVLAFGDGENDIEMLEFVGTGVAMGNAEDKVKAIADYVTADIDDDGIWKALKHFGIL